MLFLGAWENWRKRREIGRTSNKGKITSKKGINFVLDTIKTF